MVVSIACECHAPRSSRGRRCDRGVRRGPAPPAPARGGLWVRRGVRGRRAAACIIHSVHPAALGSLHPPTRVQGRAFGPKRITRALASAQ
eukprot:scaffold1226_cov54-Phaeocystis_antarctica.AAC.2